MYQVLQGKRKVYVIAICETHQEAIDTMIKKQLSEHKRGMYIVKVQPYNERYNQLVRV